MERGENETPCVCGSETFERVSVTRPDGSRYVTEFVACSHCRVMFYRPPVRLPPDSPQPRDGNDWADQYRESVRTKK